MLLSPTELLPHALAASQTAGILTLDPPLEFFSSRPDAAYDRPPNFTETKNEWLGLIDNLVRDIQAPTMHKLVFGRISKHLHQIQELISAPGWNSDEFVQITRMLRRVNESLIGILRMGTFTLYIHRSSVQQTLEEIVLLLDDTITSIQYGGEMKQLERLADNIDIKDSGRILVHHPGAHESPSFSQHGSGNRDFRPQFPTPPPLPFLSSHYSDGGLEFAATRPAIEGALDMAPISRPASGSSLFRRFTACGPCQLHQVSCDLKHYFVKEGEKATCTPCSERGITCMRALLPNEEPEAQFGGVIRGIARGPRVLQDKDISANTLDGLGKGKARPYRSVMALRHSTGRSRNASPVPRNDGRALSMEYVEPSLSSRTSSGGMGEPMFDMDGQESDNQPRGYTFVRIPKSAPWIGAEKPEPSEPSRPRRHSMVSVYSDIKVVLRDRAERKTLQTSKSDSQLPSKVSNHMSAISWSEWHRKSSQELSSADLGLAFDDDQDNGFPIIPRRTPPRRREPAVLPFDTEERDASEPTEASPSLFSSVMSSAPPSPRSATIEQSHSPAQSRFRHRSRSRSRSRSGSRSRSRSPRSLNFRVAGSQRSNSPRYMFRWSETVGSENSPSEPIPSRRRRRESPSLASVGTSSRSRSRSPRRITVDRRPESINLERTHVFPPSDGAGAMYWRPISRSRSPIMSDSRSSRSVSLERTRPSYHNTGYGSMVLGGSSGYRSQRTRQMWNESPNPMASRPRAVSRSRSRSPPRSRMIVDSGSYASSKNSIPDLELYRLRLRPGHQTVGDDLPLPDIHHSPPPDIRSWPFPHESLPSLAPKPDIASGSSSAKLPESHVQARRRRALGDDSIRFRDSGSIISGLVSVADIGGVPLPSRSALNVASGGKLSAQRGVTHYTIEELCEEIRAVPDLGNMPIGDLYRREIPSGVQHEFILIKSIEQQGRPSTWIRIDRAAKGYRDRFRLTSRYPADDTARMGANENHKLMAGESRLRAHVELKKIGKQPRFLTLADLLTIMHEESSDYRLLSENCYFFTSVIQEILTEFHEGELVSGTLGHKTLGRKVRQNIRTRFASSSTPSRAPDIPSITARTVHTVPSVVIGEMPAPQRSTTFLRRLASMVCS